LRQKIVDFFQQDLVESEIFLPWTAQQLRGKIYATCQVLNERSEDEGAFFTVRGEQNDIDSLREQLAQLPSM
jgi:GTPase